MTSSSCGAWRPPPQCGPAWRRSPAAWPGRRAPRSAPSGAGRPTTAPPCRDCWTSPSPAVNDRCVTRLPGFHRRDLQGRRDELKRLVAFDDDEWDALSAAPALREISDVMVESAVGCAPIPLGIAEGFLVDGESLAVPMAVEEPSVIAAASFAARVVRGAGGFRTRASEPLMTAQVFLEEVTPAGEERLRGCAAMAREALAPTLASLERRGGGFRGVQRCAPAGHRGRTRGRPGGRA